MELEATLIDKMQKALTKVCENCGNVTGRSLYQQLLGEELECTSCKHRNRMLYLPVKIMLMKFTSMFAISEEELLNRMKEDSAWNHLLYLVFDGIASGRPLDDIVGTNFPFVVGLDLEDDGRGVDPGAFDSLLTKYRERGTVGVRFYKRGLFDSGEAGILRTTRKRGFLVSVAVRMPSSIRIGGFTDTVDHVELIFESCESFTSASDEEIKAVLGGAILKPITITIEEDLSFPAAEKRIRELSKLLSPDAVVVKPREPILDPFSDTVPEERKENLELYATLISSPDITAFVTVRDPGFVKWLGRAPGAAVMDSPLMVAFRTDIENWSLPPEDFLPVRSVFSLVPMHVGMNRGAFCSRIKKEELS